MSPCQWGLSWSSCLKLQPTLSSPTPPVVLLTPFILHYCIYQCIILCMPAKSLQSCLTLCNPMNCSPPGSSVHGDSPSKNTGWIAVPSPGDLPHPGIEPTSLISPALASESFNTSTTWEAYNIIQFTYLLCLSGQSRDFYLYYLLMNPQDLVSNKCSIILCEMNEWLDK